jgi:hypothetical protein
VDGIFHVTRVFEDPDVIHVEDRIDPVADLDIIHAELRAKDCDRINGEAGGVAWGGVGREEKKERKGGGGGRKGGEGELGRGGNGLVRACRGAGC